MKMGGKNIKADIRDSVLLGKNQGLPGKMKAILPPKYIQKNGFDIKKIYLIEYYQIYSTYTNACCEKLIKSTHTI